MHVTSKGQVTIPQELRAQFGLFPGTEIDFIVMDNLIVLKKSSGHRRATELLKRMVGKGTVQMTTDEIMALTRK
jgi:AbrB family looped-hinge helix DNA binding protein